MTRVQTIKASYIECDGKYWLELQGFDGDKVHDDFIYSEVFCTAPDTLLDTAVSFLRSLGYRPFGHYLRPEHLGHIVIKYVGEISDHPSIHPLSGEVRTPPLKTLFL